MDVRQGAPLPGDQSGGGTFVVVESSARDSSEVLMTLEQPAAPKDDLPPRAMAATNASPKPVAPPTAVTSLPSATQPTMAPPRPPRRLVPTRAAFARDIPPPECREPPRMSFMGGSSEEVRLDLSDSTHVTF
jgi:hypothetical protein